MKIIKKIFNKIIFALIVGLVFAFVNRCQVKAAVLGDNLVYGTDYDIYQIEVDNLDDTWQLVGRVMTSNSNYYSAYNFLINRNNKSVFGVALPNAQYLNVIEFYDFEFENYAVYSANTSNQDPKIILSRGMLPVFGGSCSSGSYCYNFINTGSQGSGSSATIYSDTIYIDNLTLNALNRFSSGTYSNGVLTNHIFYPYGKKMSCTNDVSGCYVGTGSPSSQWGFSGQNNVNSVYYTSATLKNYSQYEPVNQIVAERQEPVINTPTLRLSPNYVKVNNLNVAVNLAAYIVDYDFNYNYYYAFCSDENDCTNDLDWQQLYYEQFMILEGTNEAVTSLHFDNNGYVFFKIEDPYDNELVYSTSLHIANINTKDPEINVSINYNSSNGTTIDEILLNTDYLIYSSNTTGYKCYYMFSNIEVEDLQTSSFTETSCSGGRLYVARSNGFYYARITYNDEPVADIMKEVNQYGKLVSEIYDVGGDNSIFGKLLGGTSPLLRNFTEMNGPLSSIVSLPLKLGTFIYQFFYTPSNVCSPYDMGTIFGHHLIIGCVDLSILGNTLLRTIDIIFAGFFTITWGKFLYILFRKIVLLKDLNVVSAFKGGIF